MLENIVNSFLKGWSYKMNICDCESALKISKRCFAIGASIEGGHCRNGPMRDGRAEEFIKNFQHEKFI